MQDAIECRFGEGEVSAPNTGRPVVDASTRCKRDMNSAGCGAEVKRETGMAGARRAAAGGAGCCSWWRLAAGVCAALAGWAGLAAAQTCEGGQYVNAQVDPPQCAPCQAGSYLPPVVSGPTPTSCLVCEAGTFSGLAGRATPCDPCEVGTFAAETGRTICQDCQVGRFSAVTGGQQCAACEAGSFAGAEGSHECDLCPAGQHASATGASSCDACAPGRYSSVLGADECTPCDPDTFAPSLGGEACIPCPPGTTCPSGSAACAPRGGGERPHGGAPPASEERQPTGLRGPSLVVRRWVAGGVLAACAALVAVIAAQRPGQEGGGKY